MGSTHKKIIKNLFKVLQKKYKSVPELLTKNREILELYVFTMFLENTSVEKALEAFSILERYFIDWNEVRVSTARELAEVFAEVTEAGKTGERIRRILQWIFEVRYKFDLEDLRTQGADAVLEFFKTIPYSTSFMNACMLFLLFDKSPIPLDEGSKRVLRVLECMDINEENKEEPVGLDAVSSRSEKVLFFVLLHNLGSIMMQQDNSGAIKLLKTVDSEADVRAWLPLVESGEIEDPAEIAKQLLQKERHRSLPALPLESELDLIDDSFDSSSLEPEDESYNPDEDYVEPVSAEEPPFERLDEPDPFAERKQSIPKNKKQEKIIFSDETVLSGKVKAESVNTQAGTEPVLPKKKKVEKQDLHKGDKKAAETLKNSGSEPVAEKSEMAVKRSPKTAVKEKENTPAPLKPKETAEIKGRKRSVAIQESEKGPSKQSGVQVGPVKSSEKKKAKLPSVPSPNITNADRSKTAVNNKGKKRSAASEATPEAPLSKKSSKEKTKSEVPKVPEKKTAPAKKSTPVKTEKNVKPVKAVPPPPKSVKEADVKKLQKKKPR